MEDHGNAHNVIEDEAILNLLAEAGQAPAIMPFQELGVAHDQLREPLVYDDIALGEMVVLCAEPGMGKSYFATEVMRRARKDGRPTFAFSLADLPGDVACQRLVRACRELPRKMAIDAHPLVVIDGMAPGDEYEVAAESRAIERLCEHGCQMLICLRPEAEQLAEALNDCQCLRAQELLFRNSADDSGIWELSGGIPALVMGLRADELLGTDGPCGMKFTFALEDLVTRTLRDGLPSEEQRVRMAMVLLGSGSLDEARLVAGRCDGELLAWLRRDVPLLGIDGRGDGFACRGLSTDEVLRGCLAALQAHAAGEPQLVMRACGVLAARGDVRRSAAVCSLLASETDFVRVALTWGVSYVAHGEVGLVEEALRVAHQLDCDLDVRGRLSQAAVTLVTGPARQLDEVQDQLEGLELATPSERRAAGQLRGLRACRDAWRRPRAAAEGVGALGEGQDGCVTEHLSAVTRLTRGCFNEAYAAISNGLAVRDVRCLSEALLCDDLYLSLLLSGGTPDVRESGLFDRAQSFFAQPRIGRMRVYHAAVEHLPAILVGHSCETEALEDACNAADRAGDTFLRALFLAVMAVSDLRGGAWPRAHVRAQKAGELARAIDEEYLASSAELVDALSETMLGEVGALGRWCRREGRPAELELLGKLCAHESGELSGGGTDLLVPVGMACPRDALWLLNVIVHDCRSISDGLASVIPSPWLDMLRAAQQRQKSLLGVERGPLPSAPPTAAQGGRGLREGEQGQLLPVRTSSARVRVMVLGSFGVEVDGRPVAEGLFDRRRARDLVMLLALAPGHRLRRYQAVDILWPDSDYVRGPRKLYEATSEARKQLGFCLEGLNPLVADRAQGTLGFDPSLVSCDIDDFEHEARQALAEDGDDFWVLDHARRMERLYAGGPDSHLATLGERVAERVEELETLYVDAAIAAGEAALRLGKAKLAVRYAMDAHRMRDLREDAMILLVHALRAAGRGFEVAAYYRRYSRHLIEVEGVPPSLALRRAVALASDDGPEALTA